MARFDRRLNGSATMAKTKKKMPARKNPVAKNLRLNKPKVIANKKRQIPRKAKHRDGAN